MFAGVLGLVADPFGPGIGKEAAVEGEQFRQLRENLRGMLDGRDGTGMLAGPEGVGRSAPLRALAGDSSSTGPGTAIRFGCGRSLAVRGLVQASDHEGHLFAERKSQNLPVLDNAHRLNLAEFGWPLEITSPVAMDGPVGETLAPLGGRARGSVDTGSRKPERGHGPRRRRQQ